MGMMSEFKDFIMKGNIVDLAVGVVIGGAFTKIINSMVEDVITPLLLAPALKQAGVEDISKLATAGGVKYGNFIAQIISFLVIAFVLFLLLKGLAKASKAKEEAPAPPPAQEVLLSEIRDLLKK
ncbi:MAG: Large-conductance mechanosensitive channel [Bacteroidota bacterium]|jgi:large conductance mechanosensitive channel